ncbi:nidogen-like domain-containing protein [Vibrio sp. TH_r3]|uniref:nidogen-like domain-containing protein n=1 Tax=Vibrio sp. TH_r3 TaxID=3082084 RepID=UPI002955DFAE|nr:nidogen-like domain-containing protein [Vibrio sp. TH_r3]MDV7105576.1 nidogen-like domain-containing protein [Vibrio sp. TH_r3]
MFKLKCSFVLIVASFASMTNAALLTDEDGSFGEIVMSPNDDGSSNRLSLPFDINFYGETYSSFFVNNNGNISFNSAISGYTPEAFPLSSIDNVEQSISTQPMIAPFWADVDTRCDDCGNVYVNSANEDIVVVTWENVGYYSQGSDKTNTFQAILIDRSDETEVEGDFDIGFRYDQLEWTTGDASDGTNGLGGTQASAGYDAGNGVDFYTLPGSFTQDILDLTELSNLAEPVPGEWLFSIRDGDVPGTTPDNPLMPVQVDDSWEFDFNIGDVSDQIFIDPLVAIGYDYVVDSGPNIRTVELPSIGDNIFELFLDDGNGGWLFASLIDAGELYDFGTDGVDAFRIMGIETDAMLDPDDSTAFVTGLTFVEVGDISMSQTPITVDVDIPEPTTITLFSVGLIGLLFTRRRKKLVA